MCICELDGFSTSTRSDLFSLFCSDFFCNILAERAVTYACALYCVASAPWRTWPVRVRTVFREGGFGRRPVFSLAGQMWGRSDQIAGLFLKKTSRPGVRLTAGEREHGNAVCSWHIVSHQQRRESQQVKTTSETTEHCPPPPQNNILKQEWWSKITPAENCNELLLYPSWRPPWMISDPIWNRKRWKGREGGSNGGKKNTGTEPISPLFSSL